MATRLSGESSAVWNEREERLRAFDRAWRDGSHPDIDAFLPALEPERTEVLVELVRTDLEYRLKSGDLARVEEYVDRFPCLVETALLELVHDEWELRRRLEPDLTLEELRQRFPQLSDQIPATWAGTPRFHARALPSNLGKYILDAELGRGAFGVVYQARDTALDRTVALKIPRSDALSTAADIERFLAEAKCAAALNHPHIVTIHEFDQIEGTCYIACEFIEGKTLAAQLAERRLSVAEAAALVAELADAVHEAHRHGVLHRDLKPANVLIDSAGAPHLTDFGLAKRPETDATRSRSGVPIGTVSYSAPEQARGDVKAIDRRSDVYSLGVMLYEMLAGRPPFTGTYEAVLKAVLDEIPVAPRRIVASVPRDVDTICVKCLAKDPTQRYDDAGALAEDLRRFLAFQPIHARPIGPIGRAARWCRRRPAVAALAAALLVVTPLGAAGVTWQYFVARADHADALTAVGHLVDKLEADFERHENDIESTQYMTQTRYEDIQRSIIELDTFLKILPAKTNTKLRVRAHRFLGRGHDLKGNMAEARAEFQRALDAAAASGGSDDPALARELALCHNDFANLLRQPGSMAAAGAHHDQAVSICRATLLKDPASTTAQTDLADCLNDYAFWLFSCDRKAAARTAYREVINLRNTLHGSQPSEPKHRRDLATAWLNLGWLDYQSQRLDDARIKTAHAADDLYRPVQGAGPMTIKTGVGWTKCLRGLCLVECKRLRFDKATRAARDEVATWQSLLDKNRSVVTLYSGLADAYDNLAVTLSRSGHPDEAIAMFDNAIEKIDDALKQAPMIRGSLRLRAGIKRNRDITERRLRANRGRSRPAQPPVNSAAL